MSRSEYIQINIVSAKRADVVARGLALTKREPEHAQVVDFYDDAARWYVSHLEGQRHAALKWALTSFVHSADFIPAVVKSTQAAASGEWYSVELHPDGHYRVLWSAKIGNLYESPGAIIRVPALTPEQIEDAESAEEAAEFYREELAQEIWDALDAPEEE